MTNPYLIGLNNVKELKTILDKNGYETIILGEGKAMDLLAKTTGEKYIIEVKGKRKASKGASYSFYSNAMKDILSIAKFVVAIPLFIYNYNGIWYVIEDFDFLTNISQSEKRRVNRSIIDMKPLSISLDEWLNHNKNSWDGKWIKLDLSGEDKP